MDDDKRQCGDTDAQIEIARQTKMKRRARWQPSAEDPYPDWSDDE